LVKFTVSPENGITVHFNDKRIHLDPVRASEGDYAFVSHAHLDHMKGIGNTKAKLLASEETVFLAGKRGFHLEIMNSIPENFELINSGHILGSSGLLIGKKLFYTGDFTTRSRAFMKGCNPVDCDVLIIESTFGKMQYVFPPIEEVKKNVNQLIANLFSKGIPIILMGYSLGKAQILSHLFSSWDPIYVQEPIYDMNKAYIERGICLREDLIPLSVAQKKDLLRKKPWILLSSLGNGNNTLVNSLKEEYGAATIAFSGWSADYRSRFMRNIDYSIPISDHCDFNELVETVKKCNPSRIYTVHGFADEFASHLRSIGFEARSLNNRQRIISNFSPDE